MWLIPFTHTTMSCIATKDCTTCQHIFRGEKHCSYKESAQSSMYTSTLGGSCSWWPHLEKHGDESENDGGCNVLAVSDPVRHHCCWLFINRVIPRLIARVFMVSITYAGESTYRDWRLMNPPKVAHPQQRSEEMQITKRTETREITQGGVSRNT